MIFSQRRKLLKFAAIMPMATFLSPVSALTRSGFDELIQEIVQNEQLFIQIGKDLQGSTLQKSPEYLRQQLITDTGCLTSTCKMDIQESILARIKEDFKNDRV